MWSNHLKELGHGRKDAHLKYGTSHNAELYITCSPGCRARNKREFESCHWRGPQTLHTAG
jgi:hypothetical protein